MKTWEQEEVVSQQPLLIQEKVVVLSVDGYGCVLFDNRNAVQWIKQGAACGDDFQDATNYPLVRLVNSSTGHVFYCKTHDHSTMGVATGSTRVSTRFDVPANVESGASKLYVVANGIPSAPVNVIVQ